MSESIGIIDASSYEDSGQDSDSDQDSHTDTCTVCWEKLEAGDGGICQHGECDNIVCYNCLCGDFFQLEDWLKVDMLCSVCGKLLCPFCICLCYDCANLEADFTVFCEECLPESVVYSDCCTHTWSTCGKHRKTGDTAPNCGLCRVGLQSESGSES